MLNSIQFRDNILRNHEEGTTSICLQDIENLRNWQLNTNLTRETESLLTVAGWNIILGIAHRYQLAFPSLLPLVYNPMNIRFRHTDRQRSQGSIRAFADGLFGSNAFERVVFEAVPDRDTFLLVILMAKRVIHDIKAIISATKFLPSLWRNQ